MGLTEVTGGLCQQDHEPQFCEKIYLWPSPLPCKDCGVPSQNREVSHKVEKVRIRDHMCFAWQPIRKDKQEQIASVEKQRRLRFFVIQSTIAAHTAGCTLKDTIVSRLFEGNHKRPLLWFVRKYTTDGRCALHRRPRRSSVSWGSISFLQIFNPYQVIPVFCYHRIWTRFGQTLHSTLNTLIL